MIETPPAADTSLGVFSDPRSVAVVGASNDTSKWGYWVARGALLGKARRDVYLVNRSRAVILGTDAFTGLADLPVVPELVVLCVPADRVATVIDEALALGVRGFLGITSAVPGEAAIAARVRAAGARLVGMNSLGIYSAETQLQLAWGDFTPGSIGIVSQSGQLGSELAKIAARAGLGISRFVSVGNQSDVGAAAVLNDLITDAATKVVALYLESFAAGSEILQAISRLRSAGKHTVLLTVGASDASSRLASSHTGSLTTSTDVVDAALRTAGAVRVSTPTELVNLARLLLATTQPAGERVAIVGDSGGQCGLAADVAVHLGLQVPHFSAALEKTLSQRLPTGAACTNPVDLAGAGEQDLNSYADVTSLLLDSDEVDAVVLTGYFGNYGADSPALAEQEAGVVANLAQSVQRIGKPLLVHSIADQTAAVDAMGRHGIPCYPNIESALGSLSDAARLHRAGRQRRTPTIRQDRVDEGYLAAQGFLTQAGIKFPRSVIVRSETDLAAAAELHAPYVLKAGWLDHKSDVGGVRLALAGTAELRAAFAEMFTRLGEGEYVVEEMDTRANTVEVLVGTRRDRDLGTVIVVGAGGTEAEIYRDISIELAPVDIGTATAMLDRLACSALLRGWRGRPAVDVDELARWVVTVSELAASLTNVGVIELNPVRVAADGALAVDALVLPNRN